MKIRASIVAVVALLLVGLGAWASAQLQLQQTDPVQPPVVLSGSDIGFRVDGRKGNTPVGTLVVRLNGQWVEGELGSVGVKRLTER